MVMVSTTLPKTSSTQGSTKGSVNTHTHTHTQNLCSLFFVFQMKRAVLHQTHYVELLLVVDNERVNLKHTHTYTHASLLILILMVIFDKIVC